MKKVMAALGPYMAPHPISQVETPVYNGSRYLNNRLDSLEYPTASKPGLPIGSGMIAGRHRVLRAIINGNHSGTNAHPLIITPFAT